MGLAGQDLRTMGVISHQTRDVNLVLGQRRRRWPNIKPTQGQPLVIGGIGVSIEINYCRLTRTGVTEKGALFLPDYT